LNDVRERILDIQRTGSNELRNRLLSELKNEAYEITRMHCNKLGREPTSEEFSIALYALNEAIDRFDQNKNPSFGAFVSKMIFHRLINFFRKEKQREFVEYDSPNIALLSDRTNVDKEYYEDLREELIRFNQIIGNLGYKWSDIMQNRPTHKDSLEKLQRIAIYIVNLGLGERFIKENPLSRQLKKLIGSGVDRRTLKKYRPYLCALIVVYLYDFPIIRNHLDSFRKEVHNGTPQRYSR
jgi:RNA polymerase sigma factor